MAIITIFNGVYCHGDEVARLVSLRCGCGLLTDARLARRVGARMSPEQALRALTRPPRLFNNFHREKERGVAYLTCALAEAVAREPLVFEGYGGHLLPWTLSQVFRVCLTASTESRIQRAVEAHGWTRGKARRFLRSEDQRRADWTRRRRGMGPWDSRLYDLVLSMDDHPPGRAAELICEAAANPTYRKTPESEEMTRCFALEARIRVGFVDAEHFNAVDVVCHRGRATIDIRQHVLRLKRLQAKLEQIAEDVPDVETAEARLAPELRKPHLLADLQLGVPRVLTLLPGERAPHHRIAEALRGPDVQLYCARNLREAQALLVQLEPEVGIVTLGSSHPDGRAMLRCIRDKVPWMEVIAVLPDAQTSSPLGAPSEAVFAVFQEPVSLDELREAVAEAGHKAAAAWRKFHRRQVPATGV